MRFTINAECKRGLRIIEEFPNYEVCRIEGYNGIGKSTALRLLQLCTGTQPYEGQEQLWKSFREQLVSATVHVTGLQGGVREIQWVLTPEAWPLAAEPVESRLGSIRIDNRQGEWDEVPSLLRVQTIPGNETFTDTLASGVDLAFSRLDTWIGRSSAVARQRAEAIDILLDESRSTIAAPVPGELQEQRRALAEAEAEDDESKLALHGAQERVALLTEALELAEQLDDVRGRGPGLSEQLADIERQQETLKQQRASLDEQMAEVGRRQHQDQEARTEFTRSQEHFERRERELREARIRLKAAAAEAATDPAPARLEAMQRELSARLDDLTRRLPQVNASPFIAELLIDIAGRLRRAEDAGMADHVLLPGSSAGSGWSISGWREACEREAANRAAEGAPEVARDIESEISQVRKHLQLLAHAADLYVGLQQAIEYKDRADQRLARAIEQLPAEEATTLEQLLSSAREIEAQLGELGTQHALARHALELLGGGLDENTLRERLTRICEDVGVAESRIRSQLSSAKERLTEAQAASAASRRNVEAARRMLETSIGTVRAAASALTERTELSWVRDAAGGLIPEPGASDHDQAAVLSTVRDAMETARQRVQDNVSRILGISDALDALARQFRGKGIASGSGIGPVRAWLAGQIAEWFSHDEVREALFPHGHDIDIDLEGMAVSWTARGERLTRPLAAFSSGQQAVAYTRARMARLDSATADSANRLIALDEFGAFIAVDGMQHLTSYLLDRSELFPRDQIVVVLPLRQEIQKPNASADTIAAEQWRQLQDRGYLTERITR